MRTSQYLTLRQQTELHAQKRAKLDRIASELLCPAAVYISGIVTGQLITLLIWM